MIDADRIANHKPLVRSMIVRLETIVELPVTFAQSPAERVDGNFQVDCYPSKSELSRIFDRFQENENEQEFSYSSENDAEYRLFPIKISQGQFALLVLGMNLTPVIEENQVLHSQNLLLKARSFVANMEQMILAHARAWKGQASSSAFNKNESVQSLVFDSLLEAIPRPVFVKNEDRVYIACNRAFCEYLRKNREQIIGKSVFELSPPDLAEIYDEADRVLIAARGKQVYESRVMDGKGRMRHVIFNKSTTQDATGRVTGILGIIFDITELKATQKALEESEKKYRTYVDQSPMGVFVVNGQGRFVEVNEVACEITGYSEAELLTMTIPEIIQDEYREQSIRHFETVSRAGYFQGTERVLRKNGEKIFMNVIARRISDDRYIAFCSNTTELELTTRALENSEMRFRSTFESAKTALIWANPETGVLVNCNRSAEDLFERSREEIIGMHQSQLHPKEDLEKVRGIFASHSKGLFGDVEAEGRIITKSGKIRDVVIGGSLIPVGDETILQGHFIDITEKKMYERKQKELQKRIQHTQKLESLGVMAGGIAHDFNNLLQVIIGNLELAMLDINDETETWKSLETVRESAREAGYLAKQMLSFTGKATLTPEPLNLSDLITQFVAEHEEKLPPQITLHRHILHDIPLFEADVLQVQQLLTTLMDNAIEALGDEQGTIEISTGYVHCIGNCARQSTLDDAYHPGEYVFIEVVDNGCGMDKEMINRIFDPFFSTKFLGRGLGLAALHGIVKAHQGQIDVVSTPQKGSRFRIYFPALSKFSNDEKTNMLRIKERSLKMAAHHENPTTVLVVEKNRYLRSLAKRMLEVSDFKVLTAESIDDALPLLHKKAEKLAAVLLDANSGKRDFVNAADLIQQIRKNLPILQSGMYRQGQTDEDSLEEGEQVIVAKPFQFEDLIRKVRTATKRL